MAALLLGEAVHVSDGPQSLVGMHTIFIYDCIAMLAPLGEVTQLCGSKQLCALRIGPVSNAHGEKAQKIQGADVAAKALDVESESFMKMRQKSRDLTKA